MGKKKGGRKKKPQLSAGEQARLAVARAQAEQDAAKAAGARDVPAPTRPVLVALDADQPLGKTWARQGSKADVAGRIQAQMSSFRTEQPLIDGSEHLAELMAQGLESTLRGDFCWSLNFTPLFLAHLAREGFLPICSDLSGDDGLYVLMPKWHRERCCMQFADLHVAKTGRKRAKKFRLTADASFDEVIDRCVEQHGENWLYAPMRAAFRALHHWGVARDAERAADAAAKLPAGFPPFADEVRFHSFEVWSADGTLAAGEFGAVVGGVYTSFTGFFDSKHPGAGTVQLCGTAKLLQDAGFAFWDLGQEIPYKLELGASMLPRAEFLAQFRAARDVKTALEGGQPLNALPRATALAVVL